MARPSDRNAFMTLKTAAAFGPIAAAARASRDVAALEACGYIAAALEALAQWRRDTTETARRHAFGHACAAYAVAASHASQGSPVRRSLVAYAAALQLASGAQNDAAAALNAATGAARYLVAQARAAA
jgi:hypothetical protein